MKSKKDRTLEASPEHSNSSAGYGSLMPPAALDAASSVPYAAYPAYLAGSQQSYDYPQQSPPPSLSLPTVSMPLYDAQYTPQYHQQTQCSYQQHSQQQQQQELSTVNQALYQLPPLP